MFLRAVVFSQTMTSSGNWDDASEWTAGNIGDAITENVTLTGANTSALIRTGYNYTIGNLSTSANANEIKIESGASLTLGASGNSKTLSMTGLNPKLDIEGVLTVWGNVSFTNKITWVIRGTVIIKGNLLLNGGANLDVKNGALLQVEGNFTGGTNTDVTVNGSGGQVKVFQNVNVSSGNLNGGGSFQYGGTCTSGSSFCTRATYNGTLPIELLYFNAAKEDDIIQLTWSTASEKNFDRFVIERSSNGQHYETIGEQKGSGYSATTKIYSFKDTNPSVGKNYYRLKSIDLDMSFEYSSVVHAAFEGARHLELYPNPVEGSSMNISSNFELHKGDKLEIIDYLGVKLQEIIVSEISRQVSIENDLKPGTYILRYTGDNISKLIRFTKH